MLAERDISRALADREGGQCEVRTPAGFIDVLTPKVLYEVKDASGWKGALGQVLAYGRYYPEHTLKLYLYGAASGKQQHLIKEHCAARGIAVVWHREPRSDEPPPPPRVIAPVADGMKLTLSALDSSYQVKAGFNVHLVTPTAPIEREHRDAYLAEALAVFDALLDNKLTLTLQYAFGGEHLTLTRSRADSSGAPVCYRFDLSIMTNKTLLVSTSLPGIRKQLPSGERLQKGINYARANRIPELARLYNLMLHPTFTWANRVGHPAVQIQSAAWLSVGIRMVNGKARMG